MDVSVDRLTSSRGTNLVVKVIIERGRVCKFVALIGECPKGRMQPRVRRRVGILPGAIHLKPKDEVPAMMVCWLLVHNVCLIAVKCSVRTTWETWWKLSSLDESKILGLFFEMAFLGSVEGSG